MPDLKRSERAGWRKGYMDVAGSERRRAGMKQHDVAEWKPNPGCPTIKEFSHMWELFFCPASKEVFCYGSLFFYAYIIFMSKRI